MGRRSRNGWFRIAYGVLTACLVVGSAAPALPAEQVEQMGTLDVAPPPGTEDVRGPSLSLIMNPGVRRAYQFVKLDTAEVLARVYNLDTRTKVFEKKFERSEIMSPTPASPGDATEWVHALDQQTGDIYLAFQDNLGFFGGVLRLDGRTLKVLKRFARAPVREPDIDNLGCTSSSCLPQIPLVRPVLRGMSVTPSELSGAQPKILMVFEEKVPVPGAERNANFAWLVQWDAQTGAQDFVYRVQSCSSSELPNGNYQVAVFQARLGSGIFVGCLTSGGVGQVIKIQLDNNGQPQAEQAFPGPLSTIDAIPDMESDRVILRVRNEEGESYWVFDGSGGTAAYTGVVGATLANASVASGVDPVTGRLYILAPATSKGQLRASGGLMMSDIRRAPAPQALAFAEFAGNGFGAIRIDTHPSTGERTVYAMAEGTTEFRVFRDRVPITEDETVRDLDSLTVDVQEEEGVTGRTFSASGHAYGVRALFVGGLVGVPPTGPDLSGVRVGRHVPTWAGSPCGTGDRKIVVGAVRDAELSSDSANAAAAVGETDELTLADLGEPTGRCYPNPQNPDPNANRGSLWDRIFRDLGTHGIPRPGDYPYPLEEPVPGLNDGEDEDIRNDYDELTGMETPFGSVQCSGDSDPRSTVFTTKPLDRGERTADGKNAGPIPSEYRDDEAELERFQAGVHCRYGAQRVDAFSELVLHEARKGDDGEPAFQAASGIGTIRVGEVSSRVTLFLDPTRGLVARSVATVREVQIGEDLFIDKAFTVGEAWAAGRPGTAATQFTRRVCGVRVKDQLPDHRIFRPSADVYQENAEADVGVEAEASPTPSVSVSPSARVNPHATPSPTVDPTGGGEVDKNVDVDGCIDPLAGATGSNQPVIDALNRVLGSRARASAPLPDGEMSQGTPGGYLASIQKDRLEKISSNSVNNDNSDQVPALEIIVFNDDPTEGRGRQIYQFAGVDATVTYGIFLLNPFEDFPPPPPCPGCNGGELPDFPSGIVRPPETGNGPPPLNGAGPLTIIYEGINFLFRNPKDALLAAAVWALLFAPVQLSWRRRALKGLA